MSERGKLLSDEELEDAIVTARGDDDLADQALEDIEEHIDALKWQIEQAHNSGVQNCRVFLEARAAHLRMSVNLPGIDKHVLEHRASAIEDAARALQANCTTPEEGSGGATNDRA